MFVIIYGCGHGLSPVDWQGCGEQIPKDYLTSCPRCVGMDSEELADVVAELSECQEVMAVVAGPYWAARERLRKAQEALHLAQEAYLKQRCQQPFETPRERRSREFHLKQVTERRERETKRKAVGSRKKKTSELL